MGPRPWAQMAPCGDLRTCVDLGGCGVGGWRLQGSGGQGWPQALLWRTRGCRHYAVWGPHSVCLPPSLLWASRPARDLRSVCCVCPDSGVSLFGARPPASKASPVLVFSAQRAVTGGGCSVSLRSEVRVEGGCGLGGPGLEPWLRLVMAPAIKRWGCGGGEPGPGSWQSGRSCHKRLHWGRAICRGLPWWRSW